MKNFVEMSKYAGMREDLVQAGGGNSSYKIDRNRMVIKSSGFQLADVSENTGYAIVDSKKIADFFLNNEDINHLTEEDSKKILQESFLEGTRPSIETFLHSVSGRYTLHTHPIVVNALACRKGGMDVLKSLFPESLSVPYATPGVELAKAYFQAYKANGKPVRTVFLQNHGLLVSGDTAREVIQTTENVVGSIEKELGVNYANYHNGTALYNVIGDGIVWNVTDSNVLKAYKTLEGVWNNAFCPDCVVFLGKQICVAEDNFSNDDLEIFKRTHGIPVVFFYRGFMYIHAESVKKALEIQSVLSFSAQVMELNQGHECNMLSDAEQNFLLNWDAEKYRKNMNIGGAICK